MLLHDNYIRFFVNLKVVVEFHSKVKCTNCILNIKCISTMAESHKTLNEDINLSNKNRNNSIPNIVPHTSGTSDTHPTHHAAVSEPSTIKRKQTSFQITSVTVKGSRLSTDGGEDSADDLDESHTEDASSDILDCSKTTDVDNDQLSEDNSIATNNDDSATPSIPNKCKVEQPVNQGEQIDNFPSKDSKIDKSSESSAPSDAVKEPPPDQWQHRFRVVKIVSSEPFKRGRWLCTDFMDPPAPVTEAKAEIVETAVNTNIQMISGSLSDSIPADKIAHIYEISPGNAYSGSITVNDGTDQIRQPMYGIFLPLNNKQYPLITGMHSLAVQPRAQQSSTITNQGIKNTTAVSQIQNIPTSSQQMQNVPGIHQVQSATSMHPPQNISVNIQQSQNMANVQQPQNLSVNFHQAQNVATNLQQSQKVAAMQQVQNASSSLPLPQNIAGMQQAQNYPTTLQVTPNVVTNMQQVTPNIVTMQQVPPNAVTSMQQINVSTLQQQQHVNMAQQHAANLQPSSISANVHQQGITQPQNVNISYQQAPTVHTGFQQPQNVASLQQPQNIVTSMHQTQNVTNFQQTPAASSLQPQNVIANIQHTHNVISGMQQSHGVATTLQQPQNVSSLQHQQHITSMHQAQHIAVSASQLQAVTSMHQQHMTNVQQPQHVITSMQQQPHITNIQQSQNVASMYSQNTASMQSQEKIISLNPPHSLQQSHSYQQLPISSQSTINGNQRSMAGDGVSVVNTQSIPNPVLSTTAFLNEVPRARMDLIQQHSAALIQLPQESRSSQNQVISATPPQSLSEGKMVVDATPSVSRIVEAPQVGIIQPSVASVIQTSIVGTQTTIANISEAVQQKEAVVPSQATQNHVEVKELGTPPSINVQVVQEAALEAVVSKNDVNGEESESVPSGTSTVAIDNKIEQAMDLVKSHLMFAVREEVDVLKEKITELMDRISQLEYENGFLRANASQQTLEQLNQSQLLQQQQHQQQHQQIQPHPAPMNSISQPPIQQPQTNIQNQQPTS